MDTPADFEQELKKLVMKVNGRASDVDLDEIENEVATLERKLDKATPFDSFEAAAAAIKKRDGCSGTAALQKARTEYADLFESWQDSGLPSRPILKASGKPKAVQDFELRVEGIMLRNKKLSRTEALRQARRDHPTEFERYQSAE